MGNFSVLDSKIYHKAIVVKEVIGKEDNATEERAQKKSHAYMES